MLVLDVPWAGHALQSGPQVTDWGPGWLYRDVVGARKIAPPTESQRAKMSLEKRGASKASSCAAGVGAEWAQARHQLLGSAGGRVTNLLVDGNGVAVRTWWASPYRCADRFKAAVERAMPSAGATVTVCWDGPGSWRRDIYAGYKANRLAKPSGCFRAIEECKSVFPGFVASGYEADDLIATLAQVARDPGPGDATLILIDDKDLLQLVSPRCWVVTSAGKIFDERAVANKFGVDPWRIRNLLSWMGDKVDGLPGIPGYGRKRAAERASQGDVGHATTYALTELVSVPWNVMERV